MARINKYLTLKLGEESYAIPIVKIREIIGMMDVTKVPNLPKYIIGVINLRGKIIPVMDLRLKFGMDERVYDERTSVIIIEVNTNGTTKINGVVVDSVQEVMDIPEENIVEPPKCVDDVKQEFLAGMGKVQDEVVMLIDVNNIFVKEEKQESEVA